MTTTVEKPNFSKVHCFECDKPVRNFRTTFFLGKDGGLSRYGAICEKCIKKVRSRRNIIISGDDAIISSKDLAKEAITAFKRNK